MGVEEDIEAREGRREERVETQRTPLIPHNTIQHNPLTKLISLATTHHGDSPFLEHHSDHCGPGAGEHRTVRKEGVGAEEAEGDAGEDEREGGEEDVGRGDLGGPEGGEEVLTCCARRSSATRDLLHRRN